MKIESLLCNSCGAPLEVPAAANFVRCNHCGINLAIRRGDFTTHTEAVANIAQQSERIAEHVADLKRESELARIDREWELERERYKVSTKDGSTMPSSTSSLIGGVIAAGFGIFWTVSAASMGAPAGMVLFGLVFVGLAIYMAFHGMSQAKNYEAGERRYRTRRSEAQRRE